LKLTRKEFGRLAAESLLRLDRRAERESSPNSKLIAISAAWKCDCGFFAYSTDKFYAHLLEPCPASGEKS
jgi:hypothetical protein